MRRFLCVLFASFVLTGCGQASSQVESPGPYDEAEIGRIVRAYLLENPEVLQEVLIELQMRARLAQLEEQKNLIQQSQDRFFANDKNPSVGPVDAPVQIVEFFDYRCPYCTVANQWLNQTLTSNEGQVRVVFKEFPVNGAPSEEMARVSLAVWNVAPESYLEFHNTLINARGAMPRDRIDSIIADLGIDVIAVRARMDQADIREHILDVQNLATEHGIGGTPFFIVNDEIISGADMASLQDAVNSALAAAR